MKVSQHSPFALQQMKSAASYMNTQVDRYGSGLNIKLDAQSGKPTMLVKNEKGETVKRIDGAMVANKMSNGLYVVV
ncbi:hypothetical protein [Aliivibrio kagoshimensis]|uniref:hypothetical protein n=1 Tax=Aliivibrio kagoshimensis TaxID=2910230 RepID=UPI003D0F3AF9